MKIIQITCVCIGCRRWNVEAIRKATSPPPFSFSSTANFIFHFLIILFWWFSQYSLRYGNWKMAPLTAFQREKLVGDKVHGTASWHGKPSRLIGHSPRGIVKRFGLFYLTGVLIVRLTDSTWTTSYHSSYVPPVWAHYGLPFVFVGPKKGRAHTKSKLGLGECSISGWWVNKFYFQS